METMHLFRIEYKDRGPLVCINPKVPENRLSSEDEMTPRVCAAPTILQCIYSKMLFLNTNLWKDNQLKFFVYEADAPVEFIIQPTINQVEDIWITSEMWVTQSIEWRKHGTYVIELGKRIATASRHIQYFVHDINEGRIKLSTLNNIDGMANNFVFNDGMPTKYEIQLIKEDKLHV